MKVGANITDDKVETHIASFLADLQSIEKVVRKYYRTALYDILDFTFKMFSFPQKALFIMNLATHKNVSPETNNVNVMHKVAREYLMHRFDIINHILVIFLGISPFPIGPADP